MFTVTGRTGDGRDASISWFPLGLERMRARPKNRRGLVGDDELIDRVMIDELDGRTFRGTPTGPFYRADLDDPVAALVQLTSYFLPRYTLSGDIPRRPPIDPVPEGAIP